MSETLIHGDCLVELPNLAKGSFDLIATDAPYNVSEKGSKIVRGRTGIYKGKDISLDFGEWDRNVIQPSDYIDTLVELMTSVGVLVLFYDKLYLGQIGLYLQDKYGFQVRHIGSWVKDNPAPQARKVKWQNGVESFLVATKNKGEGHHFNYRLGQSPDYFRTSVNYDHIHPNQKPESLMTWIIKYWSFKGDNVLDCFMGSGTTGVSSKQIMRNFTGIEKYPLDKPISEDNPDYFTIAKNRIEATNVSLLQEDDVLPDVEKQMGFEGAF